jgi:3-mercaptopyruvate sulfurtransferase SseA
LPTRITLEALRQRMTGRHRPTLVEALGVGFYADAHLPGAVNIPPGHVDALAPVLLPDTVASIVVYCTETCTSSEAVARRLEELGYAAVAVYVGGKAEWVEHGLRVERFHAEAE